MRLKIITLIFVALLFISTNIYAEDFNITHYYNNLDEAKDEFLDNTKKMPDFLRKAIEKEKIRFDVDGNDGNTYSVVWQNTKEGYKFTKENLEDYSMKIKSSEQDFNRIINSENVTKELSDSIKADIIDLEAKGFWSKIKLGLSKIGLKVASWFS